MRSRFPRSRLLALSKASKKKKALVRIALVRSTGLTPQKPSTPTLEVAPEAEVKCHRCAHYCARPLARLKSRAAAVAGRTATGTVATTAALARSDPARPTRREPPAAPRRPRRTSEMAGIAEGRLREERRSWRKDHPIGFVARPRSKADGSTDLLNWDVRPRRFNSHQHAVAATPPHAGRDPGQKRHDVGGLRVQPHDGVQQRLPRDPRCLNQIVAARLRHVRTRLAD